MKMTDPMIDEREEQPYAGIRTQVKMSELSRAVPELTAELCDWLGERGIGQAGSSFIRYHVINMENLLDVEMGVPVKNAIEGDDRVKAGAIPAGRYASLVYTGVENGIQGNAALLGWGEEQGLKWDMWDDPNGDAFGSRYESLRTDPEEVPDPAKWDTEVAIKLAD